MKIAVIGSGYVGLTTAVGFAKLGHQVVCIDIDTKRIEKLRAGKSPIFEAGIEDELRAGLSAGSLSFATDAENALKDIHVVFIAVGTPGNEDGSVHLKSIEEVIETIGSTLKDEQVVVIKSTVPIGTCKALQKKLPHLEIVSNPEFLREGMALRDFLKPQRVVVGTASETAVRSLREIYQPILDHPDQLIVMDPSSAEMTKYAANIMLASRVSLMNEMSWLCEKLGADIGLVQRGIGSDGRIGSDFLNAGIGFGGSCLPKDLNAVIDIGISIDEDLPMLNAIRTVNLTQKKRFAEKVVKSLGPSNSKRIAVWGLSFKPETDDIREAPALDVIKYFVECGFHVTVFDPVAMDFFRENFKYSEDINFAQDPMLALEQCDALCILTEWDIFKNIDLERLKFVMKKPRVFDGRNMFDPAVMKRIGIEYYSVGRPI